MTAERITVEAIDAYLGGAAESDDAFEDALFASAAAGEPAAREFFALRDGVRELVARGTFDVVVTTAQAAAIAASGLATTSIVAALGADSATGTADATADVLLIRVELPLEGVTRLDVEMIAGGAVIKTVDDVVFEPAAGAVYFACEGELAISAGAARVRHRFVSIEPSGRRVLREYGFESVVVVGG